MKYFSLEEKTIWKIMFEVKICTPYISYNKYVITNVSHFHINLYHRVLDITSEYWTEGHLYLVNQRRNPWWPIWRDLWKAALLRINSGAGHLGDWQPSWPNSRSRRSCLDSFLCSTSSSVWGNPVWRLFLGKSLLLKGDLESSAQTLPPKARCRIVCWTNDIWKCDKDL